MLINFSSIFFRFFSRKKRKKNYKFEFFYYFSREKWKKYSINSRNCEHDEKVNIRQSSWLFYKHFQFRKCRYLCLKQRERRISMLYILDKFFGTCVRFSFIYFEKEIAFLSVWLFFFAMECQFRVFFFLLLFLEENFFGNSKVYTLDSFSTFQHTLFFCFFLISTSFFVSISSKYFAPL